MVSTSIPEPTPNMQSRADAILSEYDLMGIHPYFDALAVTIWHKGGDKQHRLLIHECAVTCDCAGFKFNGICSHVLGLRKLVIDAKVWSNSDFASLGRRADLLIDKAVTALPADAAPYEVELSEIRPKLKALETRLSLLDEANRTLAAMQIAGAK